MSLKTGLTLAWVVSLSLSAIGCSGFDVGSERIDEGSGGIEEKKPGASGNTESSNAEPGSPSSGPRQLVGGGIDYNNPQIRVITPAENITSIPVGTNSAGRFVNERFQLFPQVVDGFEMRISSMSYGGFEVFSLVSFANWDVGQLTGFHNPSGAPFTRCRIDRVGNTAFQIEGTRAGTFIETKNMDVTLNAPGKEPTSTFGITYSNPVTPYVNPTSELTVQATVKVPTSVPENGGYGQVYFRVVLRDRTSGHTLEYASAIWDSRPSNEGEVIVHGGQNHVVVSPLRPNQRFTTVSPFSGQNRNQVTWNSDDFFRLHVPAAKLVAAASAIEAETGTALSKNPADYVLVSAGIRTRTITGNDPNVRMQLGMSLDALSIYEFF